MDFTVKKTQLLNESNPLQGVVVGKNTISTLSEILLEPSEARLIIICTELEVDIRMIVQHPYARSVESCRRRKVMQ